MATFVVAHGAWSSAWAWKKMRPLLRARRARDLCTPSYTGLGERVHLANPAIDLDTHIEDVARRVRDGGPARRRADRPQLRRHGGDRRRRPRARARRAAGLSRRLRAARRRRACSTCSRRRPGAGCARLSRSSGEGWRMPPNPMPPDTPEADVAWAAAAALSAADQDVRAEAAADLAGAPPPRSYIYCKRRPPDDVFRQFAERAQRESGWRYCEIDASHNPHITMPRRAARDPDGNCVHARALIKS